MVSLNLEEHIYSYISEVSKMKKFECVQVDNHKDIGRTIEKWQKDGWRLHTYQATGRDIWIKHYLLFEKGK